MNRQFNSNDYHYLKKRGASRGHLRKIQSLLDEWYGRERANTEITVHQPHAVHISQPLEKLIQDAFNPKELILLNLKKNWPTLMGHPVGTAATPVKIENNTLVVEVPRSAWLMEIKRYHHKTIKAKVDQFCGMDFCKNIVYIAAGRDNVQGEPSPQS